MAEQFRNFQAASRRESMKRFGLAAGGQDLSWIASPDDISVADLTAQIDGSAVAFTLPNAAGFVQKLQWNDKATYADTLYPGFTLSQDGTTVTTNYVPAAGDTLTAFFWPR